MIRPSNTTASTTHSTTPVTSGAKSRSWKPWVNSEPSCGMPSSAAMVTMLTLDTTATRSPAAMTGTATGSSTSTSRCQPR